MLEDFLAPAAAQRLRARAVGVDLDAFCTRLAGLGYSHATIHTKLWTIGNLMRWMSQEHVALVDLDAGAVDKFLRVGRRRGRACRGFRRTLLQFVEQLPSAGVVRSPEPSSDDSPGGALLARYAGYLRHERAITEGTIAAYLSFVGAFVAECFDGEAARTDSLCTSHVREFLLARVRTLIPKRAQFMATALRSFLRFLFLRGETGADLSLAVPTVRRWRLANVPRHISAQDVEQLLRACDCSSATGRRDHAILLLLARLGVRASEVLTLELDDLHWRAGEIIIRGKGLVRDRIPLLPDVGQAVALYLRKDRPPVSSRRVFLCQRAPHRGLGHPSTVSTIVARALVRAGLAPATRGAHLLRHSLATSMVRRGASLAEIGQVLRHRSPNTTEIYAKLDFDALRDVAMPWPTTRGVR